MLVLQETLKLHGRLGSQPKVDGINVRPEELVGFAFYKLIMLSQ
jgi:hypothetical protein